MSYRNIFKDVKFIGEHTTRSNRINDNRILNENIILREGNFIKNCNIFVTDDLIQECYGNEYLIKQSALLEGAKIDMALNNFIEEGKDYKNLKKDLKEIISANNMDEKELNGNFRKFMHICKRIVQVLLDINLVIGSAINTANIGIFAAAGNPALLIGTIIGFVTGFIINRLLRYAADTIEFENIVKDSQYIVNELRKKARDTNDKKLASKFNSEADRLEKAIKKYS